MDKLKMQSENLVDGNIEKIEKLFPNCVTDGKDENGKVFKAVDFDLLKQELSKVIVDGNDERYTLNWAGKKQSILTANSPINATLRPCKEESVGKDGTNGGFDSENLYIEGDNLDVLKLLRETYLNKIKMIYIDPPYNTGNDFVYNDDFTSSADEYLQNSKSYNDEGNRMVQNLESNGRFHSDWLSMMYPRLKLARDLLTDDGVIFISIDDNEQANLKKICDEIFGESNFITKIVWHNNKKGRQMDKYIKSCCEFIYMFAKNINLVNLNNKKVKVNIEDYPFKDEISYYKKGYPLHNGTAAFQINNRPNLCYSIYYNLDDESVLLLDEKIKGSSGWELVLSDKGKNLLTKNYIRIVPKRNEKYNTQRVWRWGKEKFLNEYKTELMLVKEDGGYYFYQKERAQDDGIVDQKYTNYVDIDTSRGKNELNDLFGNIAIFNFPKPIELIKYLIDILCDKNDIILDFFSGSATTAHAVMQLNVEDGGNRKFIMVQLPELCDEKSEAYKAGYKNICEIGKERIRRAGKKILEEKILKIQNEQIKQIDEKTFTLDGEIQLPDIGFRVLKLDSSNMKDVYYTPSETLQANLLDMVSNIKEDRSPEDLLFQVMLDMGVMLSSEIKTLDIKGKKVFNVNDGNLVCCFDENLTDEVVTEIAKLKPLYAVFRDSSMSSDSVAVNFDQIFETYSPSTTRKVL